MGEGITTEVCSKCMMIDRGGEGVEFFFDSGFFLKRRDPLPPLRRSVGEGFTMEV